MVSLKGESETMMLSMGQKGKLMKRTNDVFCGLKKDGTYINSKKKIKIEKLKLFMLKIRNQF